MADDDAWCASALARTEVLLVLRQMAVHPRQQDELWAAARRRLGRLLGGADRRPVPQPGGGDRRHVRRAPPWTPIHLAAADRLPRPLRYATFDRRQIPAAAGLGFEVVSPLV